MSTPRYRIRLRRPLSTTTRVGAPIRFARAVRYRVYPTGGQAWSLGVDDCADGLFASCSGTQPVTGPYVTARGGMELGFRYFDDRGAATAAPGRVARVDVMLRTETRSLQSRIGIRGRTRVRDSTIVTIGVRNRA